MPNTPNPGLNQPHRDEDPGTPPLREVDALVRELERGKHELEERLKELQCLYAVESALNNPASDWGATLQEIAEALPGGFRFPEHMAARIRVGDTTRSTAGFHESTSQALTSPIRVDGNEMGEVTVAYCDDPTDKLETLFLSEEKDLLEQVAARVSAEWRFRSQWSDLRLLEKAFHSATNAIVITNREGTIEWMNCAFTDLTGYTWEDAHGQDLGGLLRSGRQSEAFYRRFWETLLRGETWSGRLTNRRKDGTLYPEHQTVTPVEDENGNPTHFVAYKIDLSQEVDLEKQLRESQRMGLVGHLTSGIVHDFNNLLTVMKGDVEVLWDHVGESTPFASNLERLGEEVARAEGLTRQVLAFSRESEEGDESLDLTETVNSMRSPLRRLLPQSIELEVETPNEPQPIRGKASEIHQILLNLVVNARDAIQGTGTIRVRVDPKGHGERVRRGEEGAFTRLTVEDNGIGMDQEIQGRIFEPFYSTKAEDQGTGLGLSIVSRLVRGLDGQIEIESEPGQGTALFVSLPITPGLDSGTGSIEPTPEAREPARPGGGGLILFIEDERAIQDVCRQFLERAGYEVLHARNGETALDLCRRHRATINRVITDAVIPGSSTEELVGGLRKELPTTPLILASGHPESELPQDAVEKADMFLMKPFSPTALVDAAQTVERGAGRA